LANLIFGIQHHKETRRKWP